MIDPFPVSSGRFIFLGGTEKGQISPNLLDDFVQLAGGADAARIAVLPVASEFPSETAAKYVSILEILHVRNIHVLDVRARWQAESASHIDAIESATGFLFTGGDQNRLISILSGTELLKRVLKKKALGVPIAGSSAGAMVWSKIAILKGDAKKFHLPGNIELGRGFDCIGEIAIDTHFIARNRIGRLIYLVTAHPECLGIGIEEDTGIIISPEGTMRVIGEGIVCIVDGSKIGYKMMPGRSNPCDFSVQGIYLHFLSERQTFNLPKRSIDNPASDGCVE